MFACISVPYFAAAVERRATAPLATTPLAIGGQPWEARPIFAFSQEVARQGVKAGMSLRLAHVLSPEARFLPAALGSYRQASGEIVDVLLDFAPAVEPQEVWAGWETAAGAVGPAVQFTLDGRTLPARYFLDFDGLPAAEAVALAREMGRLLREATHLAPAVGLAAGRFAAQVAATLSRPNHARLVEPGREAAFLAERTIAFLPLDGETQRRLRLLGIDTLGGLARLPRAALVAQFGPGIEPYHRLARGQAPERPAAPPRAAQPQESATHVFDPPVADWLVLEAVIRRLAAQVAGRLAATQQAAAGLYLAWETADGRREQRAVTLRQPSADGRHLAETGLELSRGAGSPPLSSSPALEGIIRLTLGSRDLVPVVARQMSLFDEAGDRALKEAWAAVRALAERHGAAETDGAGERGVFLRPVLTETGHPLPERRFQWARPWGPGA